MVKYYKVTKDASPIDPSGIDGLIDVRAIGGDYILIVVDQDLVTQQLTDAGVSLPVEIAEADIITNCGISAQDILNGVT